MGNPTHQRADIRTATHTGPRLRVGLLWAFVSLVSTTLQAAEPDAAKDKIPRVAAIVTVYYHNSHADVIVGRLLEGYTLDGQGEFPRLKLASLYCDQFPANDKSRALMKKHGVPIYDSVAGALTLSGDKLAVDGVLLIAEHGAYGESATGQLLFPKRRLFGEVAQVFERSGRAVPLFLDKHLADNWTDAKFIYETTARLKIPFMAGSSLPGAWRQPPADVARDEPLKEIVVVSYHRLDSYGIHALEAAQALAERRKGGETGVKSVRCVEGEAVWEGAKSGLYDRELLAAALGRLKDHPLPKGQPIEDLDKKPVLFCVDYRDGLKVRVFTFSTLVAEWTAAWRYAKDGRIDSTLFAAQEGRPFAHFAVQVKGVEQLMHTGRPAWPAERTLLTTGVLDALLISKKEGGRTLDTPQLDIAYRSAWNWQQPPPPPKDRPLDGQ